jgi:hypothetical protein
MLVITTKCNNNRNFGYNLNEKQFEENVNFVETTLPQTPQLTEQKKRITHYKYPRAAPTLIDVAMLDNIQVKRLNINTTITIHRHLNKH